MFNPIFLAVMAVMILTMLVLMAWYYNKLIIRIISLFNNKTKDDYSKKYIKILRLLSLCIAGCTVAVFNVVGMTLLHYFFICVAMEIINKLIKTATKDKKLKVWNFLYKSTIISVIITAVIITYGYINIHNVIRTEYVVQTDKLNEDYRVVLITDIHYGTIMDKDDIEEVCERIDEENADLVILGGDIVDESTTAGQMEDVIKTLSTIKNADGIYYVNGNHDMQQYSTAKALGKEEYLKLVEENGIIYIEDEVVEINDDITLVGRQDYSYAGRADIDILMENVDKDKYVICADHQPVQYSKSSDVGVDLNVSGHTHAGQVYPVGYFIKIMKTADLYYGIKEVGDMTGVVSSGMCGWGFPIRTQKHCEYVVIDLKAK